MHWLNSRHLSQTQLDGPISLCDSIARNIDSTEKDYPVITLRKKLKKYARLTLNSLYFFVYYHIPVQKRLVCLESKDGKDWAGNILRIAQELSNGSYGSLRLVLHVSKAMLPRAKELAKRYGITRVKFVTRRFMYMAYLSCAGYIVSDSGIPKKYVKRPGQIVLNTWHGTPLKHMGALSIPERHAIGTVQHLFLSSDYFIAPSKYVQDIMLHDYMVENIFPGKVLLEGYPRNNIFFDERQRELTREALGISEKDVLAYMPTWRGDISEINKKKYIREQTAWLTHILSEIDVRLKPNQVLFAKPHPFLANKIDYSQFLRVRPFPDNLEIYDVLNASDTLITDYSSVMFDYAVSRRKIILFAYDYDEYRSSRGLYRDLESLPFPLVFDIPTLINEVNTSKNYDDSKFVHEFCPYDSPDSVSKICRKVFLGENSCRETSVGNGLPNVLIMGGGMAKNGITTSLISLLSSIDLTEKNYFVSFRRWEIDTDPARLNVIPEGVSLLPLMSRRAPTLKEHLEYSRYLRSKAYPVRLPNAVRRLFKREARRYFGDVKFSDVIHFDGYNNDSLLLFNEMDARKTVFVHNDMVREATRKGNQHLPTLNAVYSSYDNVAIVSPDLRRPTEKISSRSDNIHVVNNVQNVSAVLQKADRPIEFQNKSIVRTWHPGGIREALSSQGIKFVTIGRYSIEKEHKRLIEAFESFWNSHPDSELIIIGGNGILFDETVELAACTPCYKHISLIKMVANPYAILKACDCFVLPSSHEGLPVVIKEADILGLPVVATNIPGVSTFMEENGGYLVDNSTQGILNGMNAYARGEVPIMRIDFDAYNKAALDEFYSLFK